MKNIIPLRDEVLEMAGQLVAGGAVLSVVYVMARIFLSL